MIDFFNQITMILLPDISTHSKKVRLMKKLFSRMRSLATAEESRSNILSSIYLSSTYKDILSSMIEGNMDGRILELGSAGGITKEFNSQIITSDVRSCIGVDHIFSGTKIPYPDNSFDYVIMKDSLHHISEYSRCLEEIHRVLKTNGKLSFCEPSWTPFAKFIFSFFHPEVYKVTGIDFHRFQQTENQALMYFLHIHRKNYENFLYRNFDLTSNKNINGLSYLLSGGATFKSLINEKILLNFSNWEMNNDFWMRIFSLNRIQIFVKKL